MNEAYICSVSNRFSYISFNQLTKWKIGGVALSLSVGSQNITYFFVMAPEKKYLGNPELAFNWCSQLKIHHRKWELLSIFWFLDMTVAGQGIESVPCELLQHVCWYNSITHSCFLWLQLAVKIPVHFQDTAI